MVEISVTIDKNMHKKIANIAEKSGQSLNDCILNALGCYIDEYEDVYKTDMCSVDNLERSFFLSIGE